MINSPKFRQNPYIIGRPVNRELFFGRESLFSSIQNNIQNNQNIILLHGQRRIGKSSVMKNIPDKCNDLNKSVFVAFNLQSYSQESLSTILADLAKEIVSQLVSQLSLDDKNIKVPEIIELESDSEIFSNEFLPRVYELLENKNKENLVLLLDEFDALMNGNNSGKQVCEYLSSLTKSNKKLFLILIFLTESLVDKEKQKEAFKFTIIKMFEPSSLLEIVPLDEESTKKLIINPAKDILEYEEDAIKEILDLSAGHPYFTQAICFSIFGKAREENKWTVSSEDVKLIINKAIELAEAGLTWFWEGFSIPQKVVFAAIAEAQENSNDYVELIKKYRPETENKLITETTQSLRNNGFLDEIKEKVKIEFVRLWIIQRHPLKEEIHELDKIEQKKSPSNSNIIPDSNTVESDSTLESDINLHQSSEVNIPDIRAKSNLIILTAIASVVFIISSIIVASISRGSKDCEPGKRKELGVFCVGDNSIINSRISRGDRTLFPEINNIFRDKGIQAFQQGNYPEATKFFEQAKKANPYDPEVLIYYNNSLARQKGSPLTLAVVVPVDKSTITTQEVLRGVAQAQNQFNQNKGLNSRLLEIVIANDSNTEKAKEVAQELIKDSSILGVIGHISSDATNMALREYEKAKLAVISPTSTSILLNNPVFFRAVSSDESAGKKLAEYTYKSLKLKKAVIFGNPTNSYSNSIREIFTNQFEKLGGEVVRKPLIDLTSPTFDAEKEVAKSVYGDHAEAVMLFSNTQKLDITLKIAKEITKRNETLKTQNSPRRELKMLGGDNLYQDEILNSGGKNVDGLIIAVPWFGETSQAQSFAKKAEKQWGGGISWRTAISFDATWALIKALSNNPSRSTVLEGLANVNLSANETSGYPLKFTPEREREGQSILLQIKGGKFTIITNN
jgi:branched-chain amino acid transport system substrate-binding protein